MKGGKSQGVGQLIQTGDQGELEFVTTSKKLAFQVSKEGIPYCLQGVSREDCLYIMKILGCVCRVNTSEVTDECRLNINHAWVHRHRAFKSLDPVS